MTGAFKAFLAGVAGATVMVATAHAGGFSRGTADTDILFQEGNFVARAGVTIVSPTKKVSTLNGTAITPTDITPTYYIPSLAVKYQPIDSVACSGTYTQPFAGSTDYTGAAAAPGGLFPTAGGTDSDALRTRTQEFATHEFGLTCAAFVPVGPGRASLIGGGFIQTLDYDQNVAAVPGGATLSLNDTGYGYRIGAAYEVPEIALRAQLMYRSAVNVSATGAFTSNATSAAINPNASGTATFPQSVELKVQSGVAPGWLVFGGIKWTDWSVFDVLSYNATGTPSTLNFFWRDGWTVNGGVAHQFTENLAGQVGLTWDRGVGTGHDLQSPDVWTISAGGSYTPNEMVELRAGGGISFFGAAAQNFSAGAGGAPFATPGIKISDSGYAIAGGVSLRVKF